MSGYGQDFRFQGIKSGIEGYEKMRRLELEGGRPVNRPRSWEEDKRQAKKELEKKNWSRKGGYHVPLFVPDTPGGEQAVHGTDQHFLLPRASPNEQENRNRGYKGGENTIKEVGCKQLGGQQEVPPSYYTLQPAGPV